MRRADGIAQLAAVARGETTETGEVLQAAPDDLIRELARNAWLTGAASWSYQAGTQWILGIRPEFCGLRIDPCIPAEWAGFKVVRRFRGKMINITVQNPDHVCKGVKQMVVSGEEVEGTLIDSMLPGDEYDITVRLG